MPSVARAFAETALVVRSSATDHLELFASHDVPDALVPAFRHFPVDRIMPVATA